MRIQFVAPVAAVALLSACASTPPAPPPAYNPALAAEAQAAEFIKGGNTKARGTTQRVALTSCVVAFGTKTSGFAQTKEGTFAYDDPDKTRIEAKVSTMYRLEGVDEARLQTITNQVCARAEQQLAAAGLDVMPHAALASTPQYQALAEKGRAAPVDWSLGKSDYRLFVPTGWTLFDQRFDGTGRTFKNIFGQASRSNPQALEAKLVNELGVAGVHLDIMIDFANVTSSDDNYTGFVGRNVGRDEASVQTTVKLASSGMLKMITPEAVNCHKLGCDTIMTAWPTYQSKRPLVSSEPFYTDMRDAQSAGSKVGEGIANAIGFLTAISGGSGSSYDRTEWGVVADESAYADIATRYAEHFVDLAAISQRP
ncbi:hypothetical protein [Abyssibacter sp.]|uniref:hypothetical protein n=1 Tax=Abyssibacter sp. TaxID=2320200 RepID=UPI000C508EAA|nr:hypothetical protein [Xanthomonadales bacterium]